MLAAAAILSLVVDLSVGRLFVYPGDDTGGAVRGGVEIAHALRPDLSLTLTGRAGATYAGEWRPVYEAAAALSWRRAVEAHAGVRHDERFRREGALADFRDPTGRLFLGVTALPLRKGVFAAGAAVDYERALPGTGRLPSGVSVTVLGRVRWIK
jgi:hypothetical protein